MKEQEKCAEKELNEMEASKPQDIRVQNNGYKDAEGTE